MKSVALELGDAAIAVALHPGWVQTDMGGPDANLSPEESVGGILKTLAGLAPGDTGGYFNYDGTRLDW